MVMSGKSECREEEQNKTIECQAPKTLTVLATTSTQAPRSVCSPLRRGTFLLDKIHGEQKSDGSGWFNSAHFETLVHNFCRADASWTISIGSDFNTISVMDKPRTSPCLGYKNYAIWGLWCAWSVGMRA